MIALVSINTSNELNLTLTRDWRDQKDSIFSLLTFIIGILVVIIFIEDTPNIIYILLGTISLILIRYSTPTSIIQFFIEQNYWKHKKLFIFIPYSKEYGKITDINSLISVEKIINKKNQSFFSSSNLRYSCSLELFLYPENIKNHKNKENNKKGRNYKHFKEFFNQQVIFERKTLRKQVFDKENEQNQYIGENLSKFFLTLGLDLEFLRFRERIDE